MPERFPPLSSNANDLELRLTGESKLWTRGEAVRCPLDRRRDAARSPTPALPSPVPVTLLFRAQTSKFTPSTDGACSDVGLGWWRNRRRGWLPKGYRLPRHRCHTPSHTPLDVTGKSPRATPMNLCSPTSSFMQVKTSQVHPLIGRTCGPKPLRSALPSQPLLLVSLRWRCLAARLRGWSPHRSSLATSQYSAESGELGDLGSHGRGAHWQERGCAATATVAKIDIRLPFPPSPNKHK